MTALLLATVPVSAETYENSYDIDTYSYNQGNFTTGGTTYSLFTKLYQIQLLGAGLEEFSGLYYNGQEFTKGSIRLIDVNSSQYPFEILYNGKTYATGTLRYNEYDHQLHPGYIDSITIHWTDVDITGMINDGLTNATFFDFEIENNELHAVGAQTNIVSIPGKAVVLGFGNGYRQPGYTVCAFQTNWQADITANYYANGLSTVSLSTNKYTAVNTSTTIYPDWYTFLVYPSQSFEYLELPIILKITNPDTGIEYTETIGEEVEQDNKVSILVQVRSTSDNSKIGGVNATFKSYDGSEEDVSKILESGEGTFELLPNHQYQFIGEAYGYRMQEGEEEGSGIIFTENSERYTYLMTPVEEDVGTGNGTLNFHIHTYTDSGKLTELAGASIVINGEEALISNSAGFASTVVNKSASLNFVVSKDGYESVSQSWSEWPSEGDYIDQWITLRAEGQTLPGEATAEPTVDTRTDNEKAEGAFSLILDNLEGITGLALVVVIISLVRMIGK